MTHKEARRIAYHYLGEQLRRVELNLQSNRWYVFLADGSVAIEASVEEAASRAAFRLQAGGCNFTHPILRWASPNLLNLHIDGAVFVVAQITATAEDGTASALIRCSAMNWHEKAPLKQVVAWILEWCTANLPYHIPPYPAELP